MSKFYSDEVALDYKDVLIVPEFSTVQSRKDVNILWDCEDYKIHPVIAANMDGVGTFNLAKVLNNHNISVALRKQYTAKETIEFLKTNPFNWVTIGTSEEDFERLTEIMDNVDVRMVNVDVANGYVDKFYKTIERVYAILPDHAQLMVGNVVTATGVRDAARAGATTVKVGIGPGSVCTTRKMTGVGYPQLTAVLECVEAAAAYDISVCADGGVQNVGDIAKALVAGAGYVMLGSMFAGHAECFDNGVSKNINLDDEITYYGMSSNEAFLKEHSYKELDEKRTYSTSEGKAVRIKLKGSVEKLIRDINGGLASTGAYIGARDLEGFSNAQFIKVNRQLNDTFS